MPSENQKILSNVVFCLVPTAQKACRRTIQPQQSMAPKFDRPITATTNQTRPIRHERNTIHIAVLYRRRHGPPSAYIPQQHAAVHTDRDVLSVRTESKVVDVRN